MCLLRQKVIYLCGHLLDPVKQADVVNGKQHSNKPDVFLYINKYYDAAKYYRNNIQTITQQNARFCQWNESTNVSNMLLFIEFSGFSCNIKGYEKNTCGPRKQKCTHADSSWFRMEHGTLWKKCLNATH